MQWKGRPELCETKAKSTPSGKESTLVGSEGGGLRDAKTKYKAGLCLTRRIITSHVSQEGIASRLSIGGEASLPTWQRPRRWYNHSRSGVQRASAAEHGDR
jgi:hypothetical protein